MTRFEDQRLSVDTPFGPTEVRVEGEALHVWWGADVGPQDAAGLLAANAQTIAHIAAIKREAAEVGDDGVITIFAMDVED